MEEEKQRREEKAIVLDFLPNGYPFEDRPGARKMPIVQAIGKEYYALLELVAKREVQLSPGNEIYIGEGKREQIHHIVGKLPMHKLTPTARQELEFVIKDIVDKDQEKFVDFFNKAQPLSTRMHQLELIPGLGKKHMWEIIDAREAKPFANFDDLKARVKLMPDPKKAIIRRILRELSGSEKYFIFVR